MNKDKSDNIDDNAKGDSLLDLLKKSFDERPFSLEHAFPKQEINSTLKKILKDKDVAKVAVAKVLQAVVYQEKPFFLFSQYHLAKVLNESESNTKYRAVRKLLQEHFLAIPITEKHSRKAQVWELKYEPMVNQLKERNIDFETKKRNILSYWAGNPINIPKPSQMDDKIQNVEPTSEEIEDRVVSKLQTLVRQKEFGHDGRIKDFDLYRKQIEDLINGPNLPLSCRKIREKICKVYRTDEVAFLKQAALSIFEDLISDILDQYPLNFEVLSQNQKISVKKVNPFGIDYESKGKIYWHWRREKLLCFWLAPNNQLLFLHELAPTSKDQVREIMADIRNRYREDWDK